MQVLTNEVKNQMLADALVMNANQWYTKYAIGDYYQCLATAQAKPR